jgi:hypothetical protein
MPDIKRVYRHYEELEEFHAGMWRITTGETRKAHIAAAADLMRDSDEFKLAMRRALVEWMLSTEVALTALNTNRIAWLGHAGCCIATGSPEEATRAGWHTLDASEQDEANRVAQEVLDEWEEMYLQIDTNVVDLFSFQSVKNA